MVKACEAASGATTLLGIDSLVSGGIMAPYLSHALVGAEGQPRLGPMVPKRLLVMPLLQPLQLKALTLQALQ